MNVMDDWKLKTTPVVRLQRPMFVYILLLRVKYVVLLVIIFFGFLLLLLKNSYHKFHWTLKKYW